MLLNICTDPDVLSIISITKILITVMQVFVPVIAIIAASISIVGMVTNANPEKNKDATGKLIKKMIIVAIVFFVPVIISYTSDTLNTRFDYETCWNNATDTYVASRRLELAKDAIDKAQRSQKRTDLDEANVLVNKLEDGKIKDGYKKTLSALEKDIKEKEDALSGNSSMNSNITPLPDKEQNSSSNNSGNDDNSEGDGNTGTDNKSNGTDLNGDGKVTGEDVIIFAKRYLGLRYIYGGADLNDKVDCSGFTQQIYKHFGYSLNRTASEQRKNGTAISGMKNAKPGDILVFNSGGHVGLYVGNGQRIHASGGPGCPNKKNSACKVIIDDIGSRTVNNIRRIIN